MADRPFIAAVLSEDGMVHIYVAAHATDDERLELLGHVVSADLLT